MTATSQQGPRAGLVRRFGRFVSKLVLAIFATTAVMVIRSFLFVLAAYVSLYFLSGTTWLKHVATQAVAVEIPGFVTAASLQWGPLPWTVAVVDARVHGEHAQQIVQVPLVEVEVDWVEEFAALTRFALLADAPIPVVLRSARLVDPLVHLTVDEEALINLERAFYIKDPLDTDDTPPPPRDFRIAHATIQNATGRVDMPEVSVDIRGLDLKMDLTLANVDDVRFLAPRITVKEMALHMRPHFRPFPDLERLTVIARNLEARRLQFLLNHFEVVRFSSDVEGTGRIIGRWAMDFVKGSVPLWEGRARVELPAASTLLPELFNDWVDGELAAEISGHGSMDDLTLAARVTSPEMKLWGYPVGNATVEARVEPQITPNGRLNHPIVLERATGSAFGGRVAFEPMRYVLRWGRQGEPRADGFPQPGFDHVNQFGGRIRVANVDPWALLGTLGLETKLDDVPFLRGAMDGTVLVKGHIDEHTDELLVEGRAEELKMVWAGVSSLPLSDRYHVDGDFRLSVGPGGSREAGGEVEWEPHARVVLDDITLKSRGDTLAIDADLDLYAQTIDASADVQLASLQRFFGDLGVDGLAGSAHLRAVRVSGSWWNPTVKTDLSVTDGRIVDLTTNTMGAALHLDDGLLTITGLDAQADWGSVTASSAWVRVWNGTFRSLDPHLPFSISRANVKNLVLQNLAPSVGIKANLTVDVDELTGHAHNVVDTLEGRGTLTATQVRLGPDSADKVTARLEGNPRSLTATDIEIELDGGHLIEGSVTLTKGGRRFNAQVKTDDLPLTAIKWLGEREIPLTGDVSTDVNISGTLDEPTLIGTVTLSDFVLEPITLGDARFNLTTTDGRVEVAAVSDEDNFPGLRVLDGTYFTLDQGIPDYAVFRAEAREAEVYEILPFMRVPETRLVGTGIVEVNLWPGREIDPWQVIVDAAPGAVQLELYDGEIVYRNLSEVFLVQRKSGLDIGQVAVGRSLDDALFVCGWFDPERKWDLRVTGRADLEVLRPLRNLFSVLEGYIDVGEDPATATALGDKRCLLDAATAVLRLTGEILDPAINGRVHTKGVSLLPRNFGREFTVDDKSSVLLRPAREQGRQRLIVSNDPDLRLRGSLEDGKWALSGEMDLLHLVPDSADIDVVGSEIFYSEAGRYNATFNPSIHIEVRDFDSDEKRRIHLTGGAEVTEGVYYQSFDQIGQAFGGIGGGGEIISTQLPLTERVPWLKSLTMDLQVQANNFAVTSAYTGGEADLEVRFALGVGGTLDELLVYDRMEVIPGGRVSYELIGREFDVVGGALDFEGPMLEPFVDVEFETEVTYEVDPGSEDADFEERVATVSMRVSGVPPKLNIELWSKDSPGLDQGDLQSLILTGRPSDQSANIQDALGFSYDFGDLLRDVLKSPFFEAFKARVGPQGQISTEILTRLGRAVQLRTKVTQDSDETRVKAGFSFELYDRLTLEGALQRTDRSQNPTQTYEARLKYRIPLD